MRNDSPALTERYFVSVDVPDTRYVLPSDQREKERLELQHGLITQVFDGKVIIAPIDFSHGQRAAVLDAGTGSGAWLLGAAQELPASTTFHGIDIQSRLFPIVEPVDRDRIQFSITSVIDMPEAWSSSFDFVNQRLLIGALQLPEWHTDIRSIHRVLKPGGWVQMCEVGRWLGDGPLTRQFDQMLKQLWEKRGLLRDCATDIPGILREVGFVNVHVETRVVPFGKWAGQLGVDGRTNFMEFSKAIRTPALKEGIIDFAKTEAECDELIDKMAQEWDGTPGTGAELIWIHAQKVV